LNNNKLQKGQISPSNYTTGQISRETRGRHRKKTFNRKCLHCLQSQIS